MSAFDSLMIHTCTIVQAGTQDDYGNTMPTWTSGTTSTTGIACRLSPVALFRQARGEQATGESIADYELWLAYDDAPASLLSFGAADTHRVTDVHDAAGSVIDAGPFDIKFIADAAGQEHHLKLSLKRAG